MQFTLTTPTLLFSAISLLLLAYTNRFLALAALIRQLHRQYKEDPDEIILKQISSIQNRIMLIRNMQFLGAVSFFLCTLSMFLLLLGYEKVAELTFVGALVALMFSLFISVLEIHRSCDALNMRLKDIEELSVK
ncbi:DUF2721 domain-containing protein [Chitinispirillales bacterium ANBcel5]|uniref:DUF2721 domain-containing protein n=1 Tax=Cellulosispirillum alkaliphilum TaxID=3039283 RepID=UPI002A53BA57|nr:DUF2721 domain-containing protein [Chitinispirillales bacterium ANBcel5]